MWDKMRQNIEVNRDLTNGHDTLQSCARSGLCGNQMSPGNNDYIRKMRCKTGHMSTHELGKEYTIAQINFDKCKCR